MPSLRPPVRMVEPHPRPRTSRPVSVRPMVVAIGLLAMGAGSGAPAKDWLSRDGRVRATVGLSASLADGNTRARHVVLMGEAVRATELDRTTLSSMSQFASNDGTTTADRIRLGARQDRELGRELFGLGSLHLERNRFVDLSLRTQLGEGAIARQRLMLVPNLCNGGAFRANWDAGAAVALTASLSLNVGLAYAYNSEPGLGRKTTDTLLTTGISVRLE